MIMQSSGAPQAPKGRVLGSAVRSALVWNFVSTAFAQIALAAIFLLMAGKLTPEVFGLFALVSVLTDLFVMLGTTAGGDVIVQRQDFSRRTLSTVLWLMIAVSLPVAFVFVVGSGLYADAVSEPRVANLLQVMAATTLMFPFVVGPMAVLRQRMDFKGRSIVTMTSSFIGALAALATAYSPWVEWSLVVQRFVASGAAIVIATIRARTFPTFEFDGTVARQMIGPAAKIFAGQGLANAGPRAVELAMGIFFGAAALGQLRVASKLSEMALNLLVNPIGPLWVVLLAQARASGERGGEIFLRLSKLGSLIALPGFLGLALVAHKVVALVLPPVYAPAGDILFVLCALGVFIPLTNSRNAVLIALQKFDHMFWYAGADLVGTVMVIYAFHWWGPLSMLSGLALVSIMLIATALPYTLRELDTRVGELWSALLPAYTAVAAMSLAVIAIRPLTANMNVLEGLLIDAFVGAAVYVALIAFAFRSTAKEAILAISSRSQ